MMSLRKSAAVAALALAASSLGGCAMAPKVLSFLHLRKSPPELAVRPAVSKFDLAVAPGEQRLYDAAKEAIAARNYAGALDLLQLAKQRSPNDTRVLNAMGVVYDKLGRFDLSSRYYAQALAVDPNSKAAQANLAYSQKLQAYSTGLRDDAVLLAALEAPVRSAPPTPTVVVDRVAQGLLGDAIRVLNASGDTSTAQRVRRRLASNGWTVSAPEQQPTVSTETVVLYRTQHRRLAEALARTLPFKSSLQACSDACDGIQLILGANARARGNS
jgi:tetratricopeptide (TPR) repeat protein